MILLDVARLPDNIPKNNGLTDKVKWLIEKWVNDDILRCRRSGSIRYRGAQLRRFRTHMKS